MLADALADYLHRHPQEAATVARFQRLLQSGQARAFERQHVVPGHVTGSAWLVSADGERVLLTHHRKLGRWLQLGGHADGDTDTARVALREAEEESGLAALRVEAEVFDLDVHVIPARGDEPEHVHFDVRHVVWAAPGQEAFVVSDESHALAWRRIDALVEDADADASMQRMAAKWLRRSTLRHLVGGSGGGGRIPAEERRG